MRTIQPKWIAGKLQSKWTRHRYGSCGGAWLKTAATVAIALTIAATAHASSDRPVKSRIAPNYPELAKRLKITGTVKLEATVDAAGKVTAVKTVSGSKALSQAAEDAVSKWKFAAGSETSTEEVEVNFAFSQ